MHPNITGGSKETFKTIALTASITANLLGWHFLSGASVPASSFTPAPPAVSAPASSTAPATPPK